MSVEIKLRITIWKLDFSRNGHFGLHQYCDLLHHSISIFVSAHNE